MRTVGRDISSRAVATLLVACVVAISLACCRTREPARSASLPVRSNWTVTLGAQGGFTGGGSGHVIASNGRVTEWSQITPSDMTTHKPLGQASVEAMAALDAALRSPQLQRLELSETGNMTSFLEWSEPPTTRRWSWAVRAGDSKLAPPLQRAWQAAVAAVASARDSTGTRKDGR